MEIKQDDTGAGLFDDFMELVGENFPIGMASEQNNNQIQKMYTILRLIVLNQEQYGIHSL